MLQVLLGLLALSSHTQLQIQLVLVVLLLLLFRVQVLILGYSVLLNAPSLIPVFFQSLVTACDFMLLADNFILLVVKLSDFLSVTAH